MEYVLSTLYWQPTKMQIGSQSSNLSAWPRRQLSHGSRPGLSVMGRGGSLIQSQIMGIFMAANRQIITSEKRWVRVKGSSVLVATPSFHPSVHCYGTTDIKIENTELFWQVDLVVDFVFAFILISDGMDSSMIFIQICNLWQAFENLGAMFLPWYSSWFSSIALLLFILFMFALRLL